MQYLEGFSPGRERLFKNRQVIEEARSQAIKDRRGFIVEEQVGDMLCAVLPTGETVPPMPWDK